MLQKRLGVTIRLDLVPWSWLPRYIGWEYDLYNYRTFSARLYGHQLQAAVHVAGGLVRRRFFVHRGPLEYNSTGTVSLPDLHRHMAIGILELQEADPALAKKVDGIDVTEGEDEEVRTETQPAPVMTGPGSCGQLPTTPPSPDVNGLTARIHATKRI